MTKILVTGATGQIGSELTLELRSRYGHENIIATGHSRGPSRSLLESGTFEYIDVTNREGLLNIIRKYDIDTIYHLAAVLSATGEKNPQLAWSVNMGGLYNVLEVAREGGVGKVFWPSSIAVFGEGAPRLNTPQDTVLVPSTIYGITKVAGELLCNYYFERYNLDVRSVRYPGIISSETPPTGGTTDYATEMFYEAIKHSRYTCFVRGDTILPMMYMPDCIKAAVDLMEAPSLKIKRYVSYNVAAMSFSAAELTAEIRKHIPEFQCDYKPDFRQSIADSWPMSIDDSMAREEWSWRPLYDLDSMVRDMMGRLIRRSAVHYSGGL
jgi:nucleoside-diphosphate-sugar epimerase